MWCSGGNDQMLIMYVDLLIIIKHKIQFKKAVSSLEI